MHHFDEYDPGGFEEEATWKFFPAVRLAKASLNLQLAVHAFQNPAVCVILASFCKQSVCRAFKPKLPYWAVCLQPLPQ
jgi:hypothetical protein